MAYAGKGDRQFDGYDEDDGLSAMGRKNVRHAEELHDEVARTRETMASFLTKQLLASHPDDWQEACVDAAFDSCNGTEFYTHLPRHYDLASYDTRALAIVMEYNLPILEFQRGAQVSPSEIRAFVRIRNLYEHRSSQLNNRRWRRDLESVRSLRAKMQTEEEIVDESYSVDDLPQMDEDSRLYLAQLDSLQHQVEAITNTILGIGDRLDHNARIDEDQFAELDRQHDIDEEHDRSIGELGDRLDANTRVDEERAAELRRQEEENAERDRALAKIAERLSELSDKVDKLDRTMGDRASQAESLADRLLQRDLGLAGVACTAAVGVGAFLVTLLKRK